VLTKWQHLDVSIVLWLSDFQNLGAKTQAVVSADCVFQDTE